jgi:uncharacterized protein (DUF1697 family)
MTRYVAFLRAINVAGHATVKMTDLHQVFVAAGCQNVRTVIQSGNVLFQATGRSAAGIDRRVRQKVRELLGSEVTIMFRTFSEVEGLVRAGPFDELAPGPEVKCYVAFLCDVPRRKPTFPLRSPKEGLEAFGMTDREVFILSRRKAASRMYGFPNNFIEKELGVPATTRNWSTLKRIIELSS